nr:ALK tyrosine kinase receptor [Halyomorpha halys]
MILAENIARVVTLSDSQAAIVSLCNNGPTKSNEVLEEGNWRSFSLWWLCNGYLPSLVGIRGKERSVALSNEGSQVHMPHAPTSFAAAKSLINASLRNKLQRIYQESAEGKQWAALISSSDRISYHVYSTSSQNWNPPHNICSSSQFQCSDSSCIDSTKVCNIVKDCENGEDEEQECDKVPAFARCSFEDGWCGWHNGVQNDLASSMNWTINNGSTPTSSTGPSADHTFRNETGVPKEHLPNENITNLNQGSIIPPPPVTHQHFYNSTIYHFTTCGATGRTGPSPEQCLEAYNNSDVKVTVIPKKPMMGIQEWIVPESNYYTIIARGASGGLGSGNIGYSRGSHVRSVVELHKGTRIYILVGQEGTKACLKSFSSHKKTPCQDSNHSSKSYKDKLFEISKLPFLSEGGGGGGATYIFTVSRKGERKPLIVAAGGGGLAHKSSHSNNHHKDFIQHGHGMNKTLIPTSGDQHGAQSAGAGGGWFRSNSTNNEKTGYALAQGGYGGKACYNSTGSLMGAGGFGGGGGGCTAGGGGGGYTGGRAWSQKGDYGEGGYSWIQDGMLQDILPGGASGPGEAYIIPAISGCDCQYRCIALDTIRSSVLCICPSGWYLGNDSTSCIYHRCQRNKNSILQRQTISGPDLELNRLRVAADSMMTEYNPNCEFGGSAISTKDLKEIPREQLRLVKALGQGAFGEVYQGFFRHRIGDAVEMPVAVKTLPELSSTQAETDFLMEALIMSKFNHPNIVHFIGVCFDKHPRFIVIELLAGGDLKTFLRESRPKPDRASPLTMKDLLICIVDVAKGCKYMEENRFIHRDIAARNCLLTTKGPGRVVKIADFGMARDIYRADYYRKGGKAMLPIKWMPPEAFLDGIFTTKTDVWSFGVLMWEVMSLGYMPYTGCANREVMSLVTSGGRLEPPTNCPSQLYAIMTQCWHPNPEERPSFSLILERLGYCMQDPDVIRAPLPVYAKPPSSERDTTIMRPTGQEECIQPDYLVPLTGPPDWELGNNLPESRSTQPLLDNSSSSGAGSPATNNNNPLSTIPEKPFHANHIVDQGVFIISSNLKADTEISC